MKYIDYYKTLGLTRQASQDKINKSFRSLARKYHPDLNKDPEAENKFKEINEAYEVLKDPKKRSQYDALGPNWKSGQQFRPPPGFENQFNFGGGAGGFTSSGGFSDFFSTIFGSGMNGMGGGGGFGRKPGGPGGESFDFSDLFGQSRNACRPKKS